MNYELSTTKLQDILSHSEDNYNKKFGIFPMDMIPQDTSIQILIINSDPSYSPGKHWVSIFIPDNSMPEFFDSLGKCPSRYSHFILDFLIENGPKGFISNKNRLQSPNSSLCGLYCLYFVYHRMKNYSFDEIIERFSYNFKENDDVVINFFEKELEQYI